MKKIVLTGGGTAGHVVPHIAMLKALKKAGYEAHYIGSHRGIEKGLIEPCNIPYYGISAGKLRRYFDLKNASDLLRVVRGLGDALAVLRRIKPAVVFSKGGFVTVPVVLAASMLRIPVLLHESDITPGLANRLAMPFARAVCCNFPETLKYIAGKAVLTGTPIRPELWEGRRGNGLKLCRFTDLRPILLFMGGSQGAAAVNRCVFAILPQLLQHFNVIHLCGKGNCLEPPRPGYAPFEYVTEELPHLLAAADIVIARAGANTLAELLALGKPSLLIPLPLSSSRGDQILNAASFQKRGYSMVLKEEEMTEKSLYDSIQSLYYDRGEYVKRMTARQKDKADGISLVMEVIERWTM